MTENEVNPLINNDPMKKRNEFIDHLSYSYTASFLVTPRYFGLSQ